MHFLNTRPSVPTRRRQKNNLTFSLFQYGYGTLLIAYQYKTTILEIYCRMPRGRGLQLTASPQGSDETWAENPLSRPQVEPAITGDLCLTWMRFLLRSHLNTLETLCDSVKTVCKSAKQSQELKPLQLSRFSSRRHKHLSKQTASSWRLTWAPVAWLTAVISRHIIDLSTCLSDTAS